ncbi:cysteine peptidase family C39 domain-containing protein [Parabacteroides goldsteinii]|jgi:ABC-type bacteriocin/lantibiotic exporter with double-glycine peptidase domain
MIKPFPYYCQLDTVDCGSTCLRMIAKHHGSNILYVKVLVNHFQSYVYKM